MCQVTGFVNRIIVLRLSLHKGLYIVNISQTQMSACVTKHSSSFTPDSGTHRSPQLPRDVWIMEHVGSVIAGPYNDIIIYSV